PVKAVDTTGAGDAFHGGLALGLAWGYPVRKAARFAAAVAALKCRKPGGRTGLPTLEEAQSLLGG
ncbi:MAG: PfkB family carbohydrate kinase, partial [Chloroflexota bacterium]